METEEIQKKQKRVMIYVMIISLICVVGVSYAFFTAGMSSETSTTVRADAGTMKITYDGGANIDLSGIYPKDDVWATKTITVTGNNTTDAEMYYKLTLVVDSNTFKTDDPLQYELVSTNDSTNGDVIPAISKTDITGTSIELGSGKFKKANNASHTYELKIYYPKKATSQNANQGASFSAHVEIAPVNVKNSVINAPKGWNEAKEGTLLAAIKDNNDLKTPLTTPGKEVSAYTQSDITYTKTESVSSTYQTYYFTYGTGYEASGSKFNLTGTAVTSDTYANSYTSLVGKYLSSFFALVAGSSTAGTMKTTTNLSSVYYVVSATSSSFVYRQITSNKNITEALLASTEDDYGTSYYFRGAVKNNYVQFANKCWRIVRITGDGSVKLVLHNDNTEGSSNPCSSANNSDTAAFARYSGTTYTSAFNSSNDDNAYVGFMYGTAGSSDYATAHANTNKSTILTNLETWYTDNLSSYEDKLADTIWCNDKSTNTYFITDRGLEQYGGGLGYGTNKTDGYGADNRLNHKKIPSLICPNDNNGGKLSKFTVNDTTSGNGDLTYKVGLLTADEIAFSGSIASTNNRSTYLQENTGIDYWWTFSPSVFIGTANVCYTGSGSLNFGNNVDVSSSYGLRPAISLVSNTKASGGSGTSEDPYVVE